MTYRVRKQAITGKLILQEASKYDLGAAVLTGDWCDADPSDAERFADYIASLEARIARYDRRAAAQKKSRAERAQPKEATA